MAGERADERKGEQAPRAAADEAAGREGAPPAREAGGSGEAPGRTAGGEEAADDPREEEGYSQPESSAQKGPPGGGS